MPINVSLCDDNESEREYVKALVGGWAQSTGRDIALSEYPCAEAFLFSDQGSAQILLLDIEMPGMNGVELAKKLRTENKLLQIVFITGYSEYIAEGYDVAALHYLLKPVSAEKLYKVLDRAIEKIADDGKKLLFETADETAIVPIYEIRYIEVIKNYITVHAGRDYTLKRALKEIERELDGRFLRISRSYIVNLGYISRVTKSEIYLKGGATVPLPRGGYEAVNRAIISMKK